MATVPFGSREFLYVPVRVSGEVPSTPTVEVALVVGLARPLETDWKPADWIEGEARVLLDGLLPPAVYGTWVRVTDNPERVVRKAGTLTIT